MTHASPRAGNGASDPVDDGGVGSRPLLIAYRLDSAPLLPLVPASRAREWMEATGERFAYRCLPLLIANQAGWFVLNSHALAVTWDGGRGPDALHLDYGAGDPPYPACSHFGHGILTWHLPYLFRTPPGYNLLARGPANWPKKGVSALEGIIEADWAVATFTMNWKLTVRHRPVVFAAGEPICLLVPQRRGELEAFWPEVRDIADDPDLHAAYERWTAERGQFLAELRVPGSEAARQRWQRHYVQGITPDGKAAPGHQTTVQLREFTDADGWCPS